MRKLFLFFVFALVVTCVKAQWQFTMSVNYTGQCAQYISQYGGVMGSRTIGPFSTKSECEATRNQMRNASNSVNYNGGAYCRVEIVCTQCTGKDVESGLTTNSNSSPNILSTAQGTSFTPASAPDQVKQWVNDFLKKYETYLTNVDYYTSEFDGLFGSGTFEDYVNGEYDALVNNFDNADRNSIKREEDSITIYHVVYENSNPIEKSVSDLEGREYEGGKNISEVKAEKVEKDKIEFDEYGRPIFKGIKNENMLPDLGEIREENTVELKMQSQNESESLLGNAIEWIGDKWKEMGVSEKLTEFGLGMVADKVEDVAMNVAESISPTYASRAEDIKDLQEEACNDIFENVLELAKSNQSERDIKKYEFNQKVIEGNTILSIFNAISK